MTFVDIAVKNPHEPKSMGMAVLHAAPGAPDRVTAGLALE